MIKRWVQALCRLPVPHPNPRKTSCYGVAATNAAVPVVGAELARAALAVRIFASAE